MVDVTVDSMYDRGEQASRLGCWMVNSMDGWQAKEFSYVRELISFESTHLCW